MWTGYKLEEDVYLESEKQYCFSLCVCLQIEKDRFSFCALFLFLFPFLGKVKCWCLFGRLEARETGVLLDVLLAHSLVLYSSSRSGGLASGAIWLSSTSRRYWCLAIKYCICWEVAEAPAACRRWETVIILGHADMQLLLFSCAMVCVWGVYLCTCQLCFSVAVYLILVFFTSVVGNLKPPNGIFQSPFPNCNDTLMR